MAAFMKRRSRTQELMATVPTAAQAAWRMNSRRVLRTDICLFSIKLFLDGEVRGHQEQVNHRFDAVAHLGIGWGRVVREAEVVAGVIDDGGFGAGGELPGEQPGAEGIDEAGDARGGGIGLGHPWTEVEDDVAIPAGEAADTI